MKILIYDVDCLDSGTLYPLKVAFEEIGHEADMFDWRKYLYSYKKPSLTGRLQDRFFFDIVAVRINKDLKKVIRNGGYDLFIVVRGDHIFPETLLYAKRNIVKVVNWNSDHLFNKLNSTKHIISCFSLYDVHFSPRSHLKEEYLQRGAQAFEVLHWYYRIGLLFPAPQFGNVGYTSDISFVGSWSKRRQNLLSELVDQQLALYGWGWCNKAKSSKFPNWVFNPSVRIDHMMSIMQATKINVNILTIENKDSNNFRNYEIPAAGGFQLSERSASILEIFDEDKEIVCFSSSEELKSKSDFYLKNTGLREKIALAGYNRLINSNNSLMDRAKQIIKIIQT